MNGAQSVKTITLSSDRALNIPLNKLGESPVWIPSGGAKGSLLYVNVPAGEIHRQNLTTGQHDVVQTGTNASFVTPEDGNPNIVIAGVNDGEIRRYEFGTTRNEILARQRFSLDGLASNDGKCDRQGRVWIGTKNKNHYGHNDSQGENMGTLGVLTEANRPYVKTFVHDVHISQGPAWSPDGKTMYDNDSRALIWTTPYNPSTGEPDLTKRDVFVTLPNDGSVPDGLTVDAKGRVIVAMWGHNDAQMGRVDIYEPVNCKGKLVARIEMPTVLQASSVIVGGPRYDTLFITTANYGKSEDKPDVYSDAGTIFAIKGIVRGVPETAFNGKKFTALSL